MEDSKKKLYIFYFFFFFFLGLHPWHIEVPRIGVELKLQLPAYIIATELPDLSHVRNLHHRPQQRWILNPLGKARDWNHILMESSWVQYHWAIMWNPIFSFFNDNFY